MQAQSADGVIHDFPDGTNMSVIDNVMKSYAATTPQKADAAPAPAAPDMSAQSEFPTYAAPASGDAAPDNAAHGFGVGVRNVAEGLAGSLPGQAVDALTWPGRALLRAAGVQVTAPSDMVSQGLTEAGVPEAETSGEKLRGSAISGAASMLPTMGLGSIAALAEKSPALAKAFADGIIGQLTGGAASGVASEGTRQLGGGPLAQTAAGMAGGLVGGVAGTRVPGSEATPTPKMYGEAFAPDVSQLNPRDAIQSLIQHDINENPVIPGRAPDFGAANQGAEAIAAIGAAPDIDTAIAAASKAAQAPGERPMAQWMQPVSRDVAPSIEQAEAPSGSSGLAQTAPTIDDALTSDTAAPQSMADYLKTNSINAPEPSPSVASLPTPNDITTLINKGDVVNTSKAAKQTAQAYYKIMDAAGGEELPPEVTNSTIDHARSLAEEDPMVTAARGTEHPLAKMADSLEEFRDQPMSLQAQTGLDRLWGDMINKQYDNRGRISSEGQEMLDLQTHLRDLVQDQLDNPQGADLPGFEAKLAGNKAWSAAMKLDDLERMQQRADGTLNPEQSIKTQMNAYLNSARSRGLTDAERAAYQAAVHRGVLEGALKILGSRLVPIALGTHGALTLNPATMAAGGLGMAASALARRGVTALQNSRLSNVADVIGSNVPQPP